MKIAKKGDIQNFCHPNSLLTLQEYLKHYGSPAEVELGREVIRREAEYGLAPWARHKLEEYMGRIDAGEKDLYF